MSPIFNTYAYWKFGLIGHQPSAVKSCIWTYISYICRNRGLTVSSKSVAHLQYLHMEHTPQYLVREWICISICQLWQSMYLQTSILSKIWTQRHLFYSEGDINLKDERQWPRGSVGGTYRIDEASKGTLIVPINGCKINDASNLSSFSVWTHFATYHTSLSAEFAMILKIVMVRHAWRITLNMK